MISIQSLKQGSNDLEDFENSTTIGDSGSGLYVYDRQNQQRYLLGVAALLPNCGTNASIGCTQAAYTLVNHLAINKFKEQHTLVLKNASHSIRGGALYSGNQKVGETTKPTEFHARIKSMENDKDYIFTRNGSLVLKENADLGSSMLYISENLRFSVAGDYYLISGGIVVGENAKVFYGAKTKEKDALVKMGEGILIVSSSSPQGKLRVGQGSVELQSQ